MLLIAEEREVKESCEIREITNSSYAYSNNPMKRKEIIRVILGKIAEKMFLIKQESSAAHAKSSVSGEKRDHPFYRNRRKDEGMNFKKRDW